MEDGWDGKHGKSVQGRSNQGLTALGVKIQETYRRERFKLRVLPMLEKHS